MTETPMTPADKRVRAYLAARATADADLGNQVHAFNGHSLTEDDLRGLLIDLDHERGEIEKLRNLASALDNAYGRAMEGKRKTYFSEDERQALVKRVEDAIADYKIHLGPNAIALISDGSWKSLPLSVGERRTISETAVRVLAGEVEEVTAAAEGRESRLRGRVMAAETATGAVIAELEVVLGLTPGPDLSPGERWNEAVREVRRIRDSRQDWAAEAGDLTHLLRVVDREPAWEDPRIQPDRSLPEISLDRLLAAAAAALPSVDEVQQ